MKTVLFTLVMAAIVFEGCGGNNKNLISATGTIEATEVTVSAQVGGPVSRVVVEEGSSVEPGDTLMVLDPTDWQYQLQQAEANLLSAEAQYKLAVRGARSEDLIQAEANFQSAENDLKRMEELWASKSISQKQLDDARTRFTLMQQVWEKTKRGSREEEIEMAKGRRDQAAAQVASLRKKVSDCHILAPAHGTVTKRFLEPGELAAPGMSIVRISNLSEMDIIIYVSEVELPKIKIGQQASVHVDAYPDKAYEGKVIFISSVAEFTPKNIQTKDERTKLVFGVKVRVTNRDGTLKGGIPADVTLNVTQG
ncbi:MAG: efflux RND transporter periplasmic adaptor subunit [Bacteroidota bacterium]